MRWFVLYEPPDQMKIAIFWISYLPNRKSWCSEICFTNISYWADIVQKISHYHIVRFVFYEAHDWTKNRYFSNFIWASISKPRPTVLNRGRQILLNFSYVIEARILRTLMEAVSKSIDPFRFYEHFIFSPKIDYFHQRGSKCKSIPWSTLRITLKF